MDGDEDEDDGGAPPDDPRIRKWTNPSGKEILTATERAQFGIDEQIQRRQEQLAAAGLPLTAPMNGAGPLQAAAQAAQNAHVAGAQQSASSRVLELLVAKFPDFQPSWSPELQEKWFSAYEKLLARGAVRECVLCAIPSAGSSSAAAKPAIARRQWPDPKQRARHDDAARRA